MPSVTVKLSDEEIAILDERCEREGMTRTAMIEFAARPLLDPRNRAVRPLILPTATTEMLDRIADGQGGERIDVMRRALIDYAGRAAERWQENAREADKPKLRELQAQIAGE